jgi:ribosomal-protein-alanine N-acetyltransferase
VSELIRDMVAADIPDLDALLQIAYGASRSYERRLRDALANPTARTLVIEQDGKPAAMGTLHDYVTIGYIALLGVAPQHQRQGMGRRLMDALIEASRALAHATLALESSDAAQRLYHTLGFTPLGITLGFAGPCTNEIAKVDARVRRAMVTDGEILAAYDAVVFGGDRATTINTWFADGRCTVFIADDGDHIGGYVVARDGRIGPWVAQSPGAAAALFDAARATLDGQIAVAYVPEENLSALAILAQRGWTPRTRNTYMALGDTSNLSRRGIYGLISLGEG